MEDQPIKEGVDIYLQYWFMCKRYGDGMTGRPSLPFTGTVLEQDAELMLAFDLFEEAYSDFQKNKTETDTRKKEIAAQYGITLPQGF